MIRRVFVAPDPLAALTTVYTALTASPRRLWDSYTAGKNLNHLHVIQVDRLNPHDCHVLVIDTNHVI